MPNSTKNVGAKYTKGFWRVNVIANLMQHPRCPYGVDWYGDQRREIGRVADELDIDPDTFAAVVAVLSPRMRWVHNIDTARLVVEYYQRGGEESITDLYLNEGVYAFRANVIKAFKILSAGPDSVKWGPKTWSFYRNLCGDPDAVTVDRHHARIMLGLHQPGDAKLSPLAYREMAAVTRDVAKFLGLPPAELQASLWVARLDRLD